MKNKICLLLIFVVLFSLSNINAFSQLKENKTTNYPDISPKDLKYEDKNAAYAGFISFVVPGLALGQIYNEQYQKFRIHLFISAGIVILTSVLLSKYPVMIDFQGSSKSDAGTKILLGGILLYAGNWIYSTVDAVISAIKINKKNEYLNKANSSLDKLNIGFGLNDQKKLQVKLKLDL